MLLEKDNSCHRVSAEKFESVETALPRLSWCVLRVFRAKWFVPMEDSLDSLDSLFGSVGSPTSQLKSTVADEDKRREARLFRQKQSEEEDVDSLLSELRSARGGKSMARTAANVMDSGSSSSTSPSPTKGRGRRRKDEGGSSMAKDAALFLESGAQERSDRTSTRSRRLGGAAVSWLDSSTPPISTAKVAVDPKRKNFNNDPIVEDGTCVLCHLHCCTAHAMVSISFPCMFIFFC